MFGAACECVPVPTEVILDLHERHKGIEIKQSVASTRGATTSSPDRLHIFVVLAGTVVALLVLVLSAPQLQFYMLLSRGSAVLADIQSGNVSNQHAATALSDFQVAERLAPESVLVQRRLAQVFGVLERPTDAVRHLERARELEPRSQLVLRELLFAYEAASEYESADALLAELEIAPETIVANTQKSFEAGGYASAAEWCKLAQRRAEFRRDLTTLCAVAAAVSGAANAEELLADASIVDPTFQAMLLPNETRLDGATLRWATRIDENASYGTPLSYGSVEPTSIGYMWWSGQAFLLLDVEQAGVYLLQIHARHSVPAPVELALGADGFRLATFLLERGDDSFETLQLPLELSEGYHVLNLWYLNDALIGGQNRDAVIEWLAFERQS